MARIKIKQILSNASYNEQTNVLVIPNLLISGSNDSKLTVTGSINVTGSVNISGVDTFGDSGSFDTIDLGNNSF